LSLQIVFFNQQSPSIFELVSCKHVVHNIMEFCTKLVVLAVQCS
jgi:hypothetical protein